MSRRTTLSASTRRRAAGLTLVEVLVAMVILGFVMTLVAEVVFQVSQVARAADSMTRGSSARWGSGWSASGLFANLLIPEESGDDPALTGSNRQISGFSSLPLDGSNQGIEPFELELRRAPDGSQNTEMTAASKGSMSELAKPAVVAVFPGRAEFSYVDLAGRNQFSWPSPTRSERDTEALPRAIVVRDADSGKLLMWYGFPGEVSKPKPVRGLLDTRPQ